MMAETLQKEDVEEAFAWLRREAASQSATVNLHTDWAEQEGRFVIIPARVEGDLDAYDKAGILQEIEDSWNNREPRPHWQAILRPTSK
jgi:hypothetical protein